MRVWCEEIWGRLFVCWFTFHRCGVRHYTHTPGPPDPALYSFLTLSDLSTRHTATSFVFRNGNDRWQQSEHIVLIRERNPPPESQLSDNDENGRDKLEQGNKTAHQYGPSSTSKVAGKHILYIKSLNIFFLFHKNGDFTNGTGTYTNQSTLHVFSNLHIYVK